MDQPTAHALLRDRRDWLGTRTGLAVDADGVLALARVPAPADGKPIDLGGALPYVREVSGLALGPCESVFIADTAHDRVVVADGLCGSRSVLPPRALQGSLPAALPGSFKAPRGLALSDDALLVADSGNTRLQSLALPALEAHADWAMAAGSIALDSQQRLLWVDAPARRVHRRRPHGGAADAAFDANLAAQGKLQQPLFVATGPEDRVLVSDAQANAVWVFDADGVFQHALPGPAGWMPGAIATQGERCYVADAATGLIHVFDGDSLSGSVSGWRGPVTAMAVHAGGDLFVKPGLDDVCRRLKADAAFVAQGELVAGPFDAGEDRRWERAWVEADADGGTVMLEAAPQEATPAAADWQPLPADDALLLPLGASSRFVWLRLRLVAGSSTRSPRVHQARCATAAEDLLEHLPLTYRLHDEAGFLERWLKLLRGENARIEELLDDMPRLADPAFEPASALPWLAQWLALELPRVAGDNERRELISRAFALFARRGTPGSIAAFCELHTGVRPALVEAFTERSIWMLDACARLDFDTRLAPLDPLGWVLPDEAAGDGCCPPGEAPPCSPRSQCCDAAAAPAAAAAAPAHGPIGRAVVGDGGPLGEAQVGLPLFAEEAYRFCVVVDGYRVHDPALLAELRRVIDREKPAHTDYRIEQVAPELRIGLQARIGIDAIVGGDAPAWRTGFGALDLDTRLQPPDAAPRLGDLRLDGGLTLI